MKSKRGLKRFVGRLAALLQPVIPAKDALVQAQGDREERRGIVRKRSFGLLGLRVVVSSLMLMMCLSTSAAVAGGSAKVQVCHIPPGDPANFHTITISENALSAHLAHGDLAGGCFDNCETLCDDGNACTIDACEPGTEICKAIPDPVNCDDSNPCTLESCDPIAGCQSAPVVCDDGDLCTIDMCSPLDGSCVSTPKDCGSLGLCLAGTGDCDFPCDGVSCEPISQCHQPGTCFLTVTGTDCLPGDPVGDGSLCDDGDASTVDDQCVAGICEGTASCEPLLVSNLEAGVITTTTIDLRWLTNVGATTQIQFINLNSGYVALTPLDTNLVTEHLQTLSGLDSNTPYDFRGISQNACGDSAMTPNFRVRTSR